MEVIAAFAGEPITILCTLLVGSISIVIHLLLQSYRGNRQIRDNQEPQEEPLTGAPADKVSDGRGVGQPASEREQRGKNRGMLDGSDDTPGRGAEASPQAASTAFLEALGRGDAAAAARTPPVGRNQGDAATVARAPQGELGCEGEVASRIAAVFVGIVQGGASRQEVRQEQGHHPTRPQCQRRK